MNPPDRNHPDWSAEQPNKPGMYWLICSENKFKPDLVPIEVRNRELWVKCPDLGWHILDLYHANLCDISWMPVNPNQKEVMPVEAINNTFDSPNKPLTSPANVLSGCGATIRKILGELIRKEADARQFRLNQSEVWRTMKPTRKFPKRECIQNSEREKRIADNINERINELWVAFDELEQLTKIK